MKMLNQQFTASFKKTKNWFVGWVEEIPGANSQGKTLKEARENLHEALLFILQTNKQLSKSIENNNKIRRELLKVQVPA